MSGRAVEIMASHEGVVGMAFAQVAEVSPDWPPKRLPVWTTGTGFFKDLCKR